jgi:glycosyltransferase involved in cell wall biosynthesis
MGTNQPDQNRVCVVTFPLGLAGAPSLNQLVEIVSVIFSFVFVITGGQVVDRLVHSNNVCWVPIKSRIESSIPNRVVAYILTQLEIGMRVIAVSRTVKTYVFFIGGEFLLIPILCAKLRGRRVIIMPGGNAPAVYRSQSSPFAFLTGWLFTVDFALANTIIVFERSMIKDFHERIPEHKVVFAGQHHIDLKIFNVRQPLENRPLVIGYIGRMDPEKGVLSLIDAFAQLSTTIPSAQLLICGDGKLMPVVRQKIQGLATNGGSTIQLVGWISHDDVPLYLNRMKLLVVPSTNEGLPNVILEAMACGTPVLAASVGAIPDLITEGETGFLITSTFPAQLAARLTDVLMMPGALEKASRNGLDLVRSRFSFEAKVAIWKRILATNE